MNRDHRLWRRNQPNPRGGQGAFALPAASARPASLDATPRANCGANLPPSAGIYEPPARGRPQRPEERNRSPLTGNPCGRKGESCRNRSKKHFRNAGVLRGISFFRELPWSDSNITWLVYARAGRTACRGPRPCRSVPACTETPAPGATNGTCEADSRGCGSEKPGV